MPSSTGPKGGEIGRIIDKYKALAYILPILRIYNANTSRRTNIIFVLTYSKRFYREVSIIYIEYIYTIY